ncbi:hypothetical protein PR048_025877 [Dryococelus australis]|uniref:Uncharacterized protein n=1 Tax=Dryococelus australis TaxID=614101 RepID=A0ABQ9GJT5_9NEOP|nr:hypothetical protein PR048_025877 [Dryococelus australis]
MKGRRSPKPRGNGGRWGAMHATRLSRGRWGVVVRLLTSHLSELGSIPGGIAPGFSHVGIVPHDAAGRLVFSGISRFPRPCIPVSPTFPNLTLSPGGELVIHEKIRRPTASSGTILTCENPVTRPGIEPGSPWWEASVLIAQPPVIPGAISAFDVQKRRSNKDDTVMCIKCTIASTHKAVNWCVAYDYNFTEWKVHEEVWTALNNVALRADEGEAMRVRNSAGMRGWVERDNPEKTRRPAASSGKIPTRVRRCQDSCRIDKNEAVQLTFTAGLTHYSCRVLNQETNGAALNAPGSTPIKPAASCIVQHDSHMRKSGSEPVGYRARNAVLQRRLVRINNGLVWVGKGYDGRREGVREGLLVDLLHFRDLAGVRDGLGPWRKKRRSAACRRGLEPRATLSHMRSVSPAAASLPISHSSSTPDVAGLRLARLPSDATHFLLLKPLSRVESVKSKWFAFESLQFLNDKTAPRHTLEAGVEHDIDPTSVQSMSRQSQCSRVLQAPSRTVGFTRRFRTVSSIQDTNTSLAVVHTIFARAHSPGGLHQRLQAAGLRHQSHENILASSLNVSGSLAGERKSVSPASFAAVGIHGIPRRGTTGHERIVPGRGEGEVGLLPQRGASELAPAAARISIFGMEQRIQTR